MDWAISLKVGDNQSIESAINKALDPLVFQNPSFEYFIEDLEATGPRGAEFSDKVGENDKGFKLDKEELIQILEEDGQILELKLFVKLGASSQFIILVRDGSFVDIIGTGPKPLQVQAGAYEDKDMALFFPHE